MESDENTYLCNRDNQKKGGTAWHKKRLSEEAEKNGYATRKNGNAVSENGNAVSQNGNAVLENGNAIFQPQKNTALNYM